MDTTVEDIAVTQEEIDAYLEHHGIKGQKWGIRRTPQQLSGGGSHHNQVSDNTSTSVGPSGSPDSHRNGITKFKDKPKNLTDAELQTRIKRLETEKRYKELNKRQVSVGQKHINEVLVTVGKNVAIKVGTGAAVYGVKKGLDKKFGAGKGAEIIPKKG